MTLGEALEGSSTKLWMQLAALCFGLWAAAIPIGASMVNSSIQRIVDEQKAQTNELRVQAEKLDAYKLVMESRITVVTERQDAVRKTLSEQGEMLRRVQTDRELFRKK